MATASYIFDNSMDTSTNGMIGAQYRSKVPRVTQINTNQKFLLQLPKQPNTKFALCNNKKPSVHSARKLRKVRFTSETTTHAAAPVSDSWVPEECFRRTSALLKTNAQWIVEQRPEIRQAMELLRESYKPTSDKRQTRQSIAKLARVGIRGMEQRIAPSIRDSRKKYSFVLLLLQDKLISDGIVNRETRDYLLYQKSLELSQPSRQLALKLAHADILSLRET